LLGALEGRASAFCRTTTCRTSGAEGEGENNTCQLPPERTDPDCQKDCCRPVFWKRPCVSFSLDTSNLRSEQVGPIRDILTAAFETWTKRARCPGTSQRPAIDVKDHFGPVLCGHAEYNSTQGNANIITFRKNWPYDPLELGHTVVTYLTATGELVDADIEMNADYKFTTELPTVENDLQSVLTHEIGHFLGISHTTEAPSMSIMQTGYNAGDELRALRPDDLDALCDLYSTKVDATAFCEWAPPNGFVAECAFDPSSGGWCAAEPVRLPGRGANLALFVCALVAAAALRRRRRKLTC
jgi:hypothetical protein